MNEGASVLVLRLILVVLDSGLKGWLTAEIKLAENIGLY